MSRTIEASQLIDERPIGRFQAMAIALCALVVFVEGFDAQAIAYVAPSISVDWSLAKGALGPVFAAGLAGIMLGSLFIAPLADRIGRRQIIILSTATFGVLTLVTPLANDTTTLLVLRFLTGFGLGGAMPNAISLTSEYSPARRRGFLVMLMFGGFSLGSALGGFAAAYVIPRQGWEAVFIVGGVMPLLLLPLLWACLPESLRFLAASGRQDASATALLRRLDPTATAADRVVASEAATARGSIVELFRHGRARVTILLWIIFFMSLLDLYLIVNWLPTTLTISGTSIGQAAITGSIFQIGGLFGTIVIGLLSDRVGAGRMLTIAYVFAAICIGLIGMTHGGSIATLIAVAGAGFGVVGGQIGANALSATFYPTTIRSTGVGWALGIGRIGSIVGPLVGGMLLALDMAPQQLFLISVIPVLVAAIAAAVVQAMFGPATATGQRPTILH
jgi:AAHS family 4-hydroxybenzoate transporter-like MFS transporter